MTSRVETSIRAAATKGFDAVAGSNCAHLAISDACRSEDAHVARVYLPHRLPAGFHDNSHRTTEVQ